MRSSDLGMAKKLENPFKLDLHILLLNPITFYTFVLIRITLHSLM